MLKCQEFDDNSPFINLYLNEGRTLKMSGKKNSVLPIIMMVLIFFLAACGSNEETGNPSKANSNNKGELNLVNSGEFTFVASGELKPFSFMKEGKMVGFDIDVGKAIAKQLELKPNPQKAKFSGIITGVKQNRYDAAVANHTITEKRKKQVNFSNPYYYNGPVIFTRPNSKIKDAKDLEGKEVSVARGTTYVSMVKEYTDDIPQVDSDVVALQSLAKGHHDAVVTDSTTGQTAIKQGLDLVAQKQLKISKLGIPVAKEHDNLLKEINKALEDLRKKGKLKEISKKWIGKDVTEPPKELNE